MTSKLDPTAWAILGDDTLDNRDGVQYVDEDMIFDYVTGEENALPEYSARPFAAWLDENWSQYTDDPREGLLTNRDVIASALVDWCGGRTR